MDFLKKHAHWIAAGILLVHAIASFAVSREESMIFDEKAHIPAAYSYVRYGDMRLNPEHPPLIKDLAGLPLLLVRPDFPLTSTEWRSGINEQWTIGDIFVNCSRPDTLCNDADAILLWSRLSIILLSILLGIVLFVWTKELGGTLAGLFAVLLYAADPNIIAHNHYVTTDLGIALFIFLAFYFFIRFLKAPTLKNTLVAGIFLGLAELTKFSAVLLFPVFGLFVLLYALARRTPENTPDHILYKLKTVFAYGLKYAGSIAVCFVLIWSLYAWNTYNMPVTQVEYLANFYLGQHNAPAQFAHDLVISANNSPLFRPLAEYFLGVAMVFARVASGNVHYFLGTVSDKASPWYFPAVFVLKETIPFLFLLLITAGYSLYRTGKSIVRKQLKQQGWSAFLIDTLRTKTVQIITVFFILFYGYVSVTGNLTIGFRHLFPILPFLYMLVAKTVVDFLKRCEAEPATRTVVSWLFGIIIFTVAAIPVLTYPNYLSYFNPIVGGNQNGYRYVTDSNYDWGQDLKRLRTFVETHNRCKGGASDQDDRCAITAAYPPIDKIRVDYFGGGSPIYYLKDAYIPWWDKREPESGWYAISSFFYQESLYKPKSPEERNYEWLRNIAPVTRAGDSIFIYYIPE